MIEKIQAYKIIKEEHLYTSEEKLKHCGDGEWVEEPDVTEFEYLGYEARIVRFFRRDPYFGGHLCGYVRIPSNHPYFTKEDFELDCHGGINFNRSREEHWVGFDCAHFMDIIPTLDHVRNTSPDWLELKNQFPLPEGMEENPCFNLVYRNLEYCINECIKIIDQLKKEEVIF